ncbi:MAG: Na+/H+ antiporter NhaC family protein [Clostridium sp.]|uniref:YfcC family protein n=1 Tax=Clostridium sp. TaxID=1506 RepID=UPI00307516AF
MTKEIKGSKKKSKFEFKMPHTYVLLSCILIVVAVLANIIPAGEFDRVKDVVSGKMVVIPGTFKYIQGQSFGIFDLFMAVQNGFVDAADIIFFIIFAYAFVYTLIKNGTFDAVLGTMIRKLGNRIQLMIPVCMLTFGVLGATMGLYEEAYGLLPVFIGMAVALGYDAVLGGAIVFIGVSTGFSAAIINPFTVGVAQQIAGVPMLSGIGFRVVCFVVFMTASILYTWRYAIKIKADPTKSVLYGVEMESRPSSNKEELIEKRLTVRHKLCGVAFIITIIALLYGTTKLGWYISELAALFLMMMIVVGKIGGFTFTEIANTLVESTKTMVFGILVCGFSRAVIMIMKDAQITDTIVNFFASLLQGTSTYTSALGMLAIQNVINFFITGSTSQASITMPIMAPVAELIGLNKQIAVLAFQFGDGFSNMFWPTVVAFECGLMGIPINKWYKFIAPLFGIMFVLQTIMMVIAVAIGFS